MALCHLVHREKAARGTRGRRARTVDTLSVALPGALVPQRGAVAVSAGDVNRVSIEGPGGGEEFARLWAAHDLSAEPAPRKTVRHPVIGPLTLDCRPGHHRSGPASRDLHGHPRLPSGGSPVTAVGRRRTACGRAPLTRFQSPTALAPAPKQGCHGLTSCHSIPSGARFPSRRATAPRRRRGRNFQGSASYAAYLRGVVSSRRNRPMSAAR